MKESLKNRMREAGENLMAKAERKIDNMQGSGYNCCKKRKMSHSTSDSKRRKVVDIFTE
jgi:hypothetical protein